MSSSVAAPKPTCSELQVEHPPNDAATCWWLSVNFALFHRLRPEIKEFIDKSDDISKVYKQISEHYTGVTNNITNIAALRSDVALKKFNTKDFTIDKSSYQDASQYISKLLGNKELIGSIEEPLIQIETYQITDENNEPLLYDIKLHMLAKGIEVPLFDKSTNKKPKGFSVKTYKLTTNNTSFILYFPRSPREKKADGTPDETKPITNKLKVLKELYMPVDNNIIKYELDAFVGAQPGHYYSAAKCSTSEQWQEHGNNKSGINATKTYTNFKSMIEENIKLEEEAILLFYTREGTPTPPPPTSLPLPAPLPGPPGSVAPLAPEPLPEPLPAPPGGVPEPLPAPPDVGAPAPLPAPPGGVPEPLPAPPGGVPEPLPEPPGLAGDAPPVLPEPPEPLPAPPAAAAAAAAAPPPPP